MAVKTLDELIAGLSGPEKELFEKTLNANPELKDGWLRQDDFSRKSAELQARKAEADEAIAYKEKMEPWADSAYERLKAAEEAGIMDAEGKVLWEDQKAEYERKIAAATAAAAVSGEDMDPAKLKEAVLQIAKESGMALSKEEIQALTASEAKKLAEAEVKAQLAAKETEFNEKTIPFVAGFSTSFALAAAKYVRETGKDFTAEDQKKVYEMMSREKNFDPHAMVDEYMKPALEAKNADAEIERRAKERVDEILKQRGHMPGAGDETYIPQPDQKGNLQKMLDRSAQTDTDVESLIAAGAAKAASELRTEGKV